MTKLEQVRTGKAVLDTYNVLLTDIERIIKLEYQCVSHGRYFRFDLVDNRWGSSCHKETTLPIVLASEVLKEMEDEFKIPENLGDNHEYSDDLESNILVSYGQVKELIAKMKQEILKELKEEDLDFSKPLNKAIDAVIENYKEAGLVVTRDDFEVVKKGDGFDFRRKEEPKDLANSGENEKPKFKVGDVVCYLDNVQCIDEIASNGDYFLRSKNGEQLPFSAEEDHIKLPTPQQKAEFECPYEKGEMCAVWDDDDNYTYMEKFKEVQEDGKYLFADRTNVWGCYEHHVSLSDPELLNKLPKD